MYEFPRPCSFGKWITHSISLRRKCSKSRYSTSKYWYCCRKISCKCRTFTWVQCYRLKKLIPLSYLWKVTSFSLFYSSFREDFERNYKTIQIPPFKRRVFIYYFFQSMIHQPNGSEVHELDIHYDDCSKKMDNIMAWVQKIPFVDLSGYATHPHLYIPPRPEKIIVNEVGPREADQAGWGFQVWQKRDMIRAGIRANLPAIEVGFAAWVDMPTVEWAVSNFWKQNETRLSALTGFFPGAINDASRVLERADNGWIHLFYPTQSDHIRVLSTDANAPIEDIQGDVLRSIEQNVTIAKNNLGNVQFSPEVAMDTDPVYLLEAVRTAIIAGANSINMPDTRWGAPTWYVRKVFTFIHWWTQDLRDKYSFTFSCHNHNDTWLAIANSLAAIEWWASQVETTFLWLWEWAWNVPTEQMVQVLRQMWYTLGSIKHLEVARIAEYVRAAVYGRVVEPYGLWSDADGAWVHKDRWLKYVSWCEARWITPNPNFYRAGAGYINFQVDENNVSIGKLWGKWQYVHALSLHGVPVWKNSWAVSSLQRYFSWDEDKDAPPGLTQEVKVVYDSNVFAEYLRNEGILSGEIYNVENNQVKIEFTFDDVKYAITWTMSASSWPIPTTIHAINEFLWGNHIELIGNPLDMPIFTPAIAHQQFPLIHPEAEWGHVEDASLWAEVLVSVTGVQKKSRVKWQNTDLTYAKAIFEAALPLIQKKIQTDL